MARSGREKSEMGIYHVLLRGMNVLFPEETDFNEFKGLLKKYSDAGIIKVFSYTLLKNRIHLVVDTGEDVGKALKPLCTSYARYFNRTYAREGKIFYDRLKSEPINSNAQLKSVVAFVNEVGERMGRDYPHCSLTDSNDICTKERLTEAERISTKITEMYMEDYDCLSEEELDLYITYLCGTAPADFEKLSQEQQQEAIEKLTKKRWIARTKLYAILGMKKPRKKVEEPKTEKKPQVERKQELSVWLL